MSPFAVVFVFVGLANYACLLADRQFWLGVRRVALFTVMMALITMVIAHAVQINSMKE